MFHKFLVQHYLLVVQRAQQLFVSDLKVLLRETTRHNGVFSLEAVHILLRNANALKTSVVSVF